MTAQSSKISRLAIIGLGLIGSSIARAAKKYGAAKTILGHDSNKEVRAKATALKICDHIADSIDEAVTDADLVVLAVPLSAYENCAAEMAGHIKSGAIISDVGSVKAVVFERLRALPAHAHILPGHPVAGTEQSGPESGFATLFRDRWAILTPAGDSNTEALAHLTSFWERLGSRVEIMDAAHHDLVLAITSHVPHLIAYNIVGTASDLEEVTRSEVIKYSAGGFRDFTRIAASDPTMWRDVFLANKDAVLEMLGRFNEDLSALQRAIRWEDGEALYELFTRTRDIRRRIIDAGQDASAPDFGRPHDDNGG